MAAEKGKAIYVDLFSLGAITADAIGELPKDWFDEGTLVDLLCVDDEDFDDEDDDDDGFDDDELEDEDVNELMEQMSEDDQDDDDDE